ncbi:MAG: PIN domain nuclease [Termitinemataceae bacterium]|nr:MAG: PIN domain nuclease [Termitinemataceae bacterium]
MRTVLIDLNIILDYLGKRNGWEKVAEFFKLVVTKKIKGFVCAHEITTLSYFLSKEKLDRTNIKKIISVIMRRFEIIEVSKEILNNALYSTINDYEDAVIEVSAKEKNIDYIITRNIKDFKQSQIKALLPEEYLIINKNS